MPRDVPDSLHHQAHNTQLYITMENGPPPETYQWQYRCRRCSTKRGIFQGNSLSSLIFCLVLDSLIELLNKMDRGYHLRGRSRNKDTTIHHLLYMDDLEQYSSNENQVHQQLQIVHEFSRSIRMDFVSDKCAKLIMKHGKIAKRENMELDDRTSIHDLTEREV